MQKTILIFGSEEDCLALERMLEWKEYEIVRVLSFNKARELAPHASAIICEACLPENDNWKQVLKVARGAEPSPAVIVCSKRTDHRLWMDVLELGGHDVLLKPFNGEEVERVVRLATTDRATIITG